MARSAPQPLRTLLAEALGQVVTTSGDASSWAPMWALATGPAIARHSRPHRYSQATLEVVVDGPEWCAELEQREVSLRQRICELLPTIRLNRIVFRTRNPWSQPSSS